MPGLGTVRGLGSKGQRQTGKAHLWGRRVWPLGRGPDTREGHRKGSVEAGLVTRDGCWCRAGLPAAAAGRENLEQPRAGAMLICWRHTGQNYVMGSVVD